MEEIEALLARSDDIQLRAALDGLPGIGKTELARQVVARLARGKRFPGGVFWFAAEHADLRIQWAEIAEKLGVPPLQDLGHRAAWAVNELEDRAQRGEQILIVLDNVETWAPPPGPLPNSSAIRLLVTTRTRWLHNSFRPYEIRPLEVAHARKLMATIVGREVANSDSLINVLGGHVLSIELAATYLREYGTPPDEYLGLLLAGKNPAHKVTDRTSYQATAESAFRLLWQRLAPELRIGWLLAACLPPDSFSSELADAIGLDLERRQGLVRLHILDRDAQGRHQLHRLLREFALAEHPDTSVVQEAVVSGAAELLAGGDPLLCFRRYGRDAACFEYLLDRADACSGSLSLRVACGTALQQLGDLQRARPLFEGALAANREIHGDGHPVVAASLSNLAGIMRQLGELHGAHALFKSALDSQLQSYGDAHPVVATSRANLASVLRKLGQRAEARALFEQALASDVKTYGNDHPEVAITRANLAGLLQELCDRPAARILYEQALAANLKAYGEDHPATAAVRTNLARVLQDLGELDAAHRLLEQALASTLCLYGEDHPEVATNRAHLAILLLQERDVQAAKTLLERALASNLRTYGGNHPEVATTRANLSKVLESIDRAAACALCAEAFASDLETYGTRHPTVEKRRRTLARLLGGPAFRAAYVLDEEFVGAHRREKLQSEKGTVYHDSVAGRRRSFEIKDDAVLIKTARRLGAGSEYLISRVDAMHTNSSSIGPAASPFTGTPGPTGSAAPSGTLAASRAPASQVARSVGFWHWSHTARWIRRLLGRASSGLRGRRVRNR